MKSSNNQVPPGEGFELFDGDEDDLDLDYDEELDGRKYWKWQPKYKRANWSRPVKKNQLDC